MNQTKLKPLTSYNEIRKQMIAEHWNKRKVNNWYEISKEEAMQWKYGKTIQKEKEAINRSRQRGIPQEDLDEERIEIYKKTSTKI